MMACAAVHLATLKDAIDVSSRRSAVTLHYLAVHHVSTRCVLVLTRVNGSAWSEKQADTGQAQALESTSELCHAYKDAQPADHAATLCRLQAQAGRAVRALRLNALLTIAMHLDALVSKGRWQGEASSGAV